MYKQGGGGGGGGGGGAGLDRKRISDALDKHLEKAVAAAAAAASPSTSRGSAGGRGGGDHQRLVVPSSASSMPKGRCSEGDVTRDATRPTRLPPPPLFFFLLAVSRGASCLRLRNPSFAWCADAVAAMGGDRLHCGSRELVLDWYSVVFDMISDCIYSSLWGFRRLR